MGALLQAAGPVTQFFSGLGLPPWAVNVVLGLLKGSLFAGFIALNALVLIYAERKVSAYIQNRLGPVKVGPKGLLQTTADVIKLLAKEDIVPAGADRVLFVLAPMLVLAGSVAVWVVIPFAPGLQVRDLNVGLLYISAITSFTALSFLLAGWGSNNKWSLLGAIRSAAQLISYEVPLVLAVVAVGMLAGSLRLGDVVQAQQEGTWFVLLQPVGFLVFLVAGIAELNRGPFDLPEAEQELVAGFNTEYSGFRWAMFFLAEYGNLVAWAALGATLFLGGWTGPFLPPLVWFLIKVYGFVLLAMWLKWTLPRLRVDQLMTLGWYALIPLALINLGWTGFLVLRG